MAEILGSAVASEAVSKLSSILYGSPCRDMSNEDKAERLEMAILKIQSIVAVAEDWQIIQDPLLNWKVKLKRVAKEGDDILHAYKRRSNTEFKQNEGTARQASYYKRITRATKRFMPFGRREENLISDAVLRRFDGLADGADNFIRYVQIGSRPKNFMSLKLPIEFSLHAGKTLEFSLKNDSQDVLLLLHPWDSKSDSSRKEVALFLSYDDTSPEKSMKLCVLFRLLQEHIDILGIVMTCFELLPPQFGAACVSIKEIVKEILLQETGYSNPSAMSVWCGATAWKCHHSTIDPTEQEGCSNGKMELPSPIIRISAVCFPLPLRVMCQITPNLVPSKYSDNFEQIEPPTMQELYAKLKNPSLDNGELLAWKGNWWCPRSSMYFSVEPVFSAPPTLEQLYMIEN